MNGNWTVDDVPDLSSKVAIVTGASGGIGLEVAREMARKNARVVLACRSEKRARAARESIRSGIPNAEVEILPLDLANLKSVLRFAEAFEADFARLDILVNNAGVMLVPYGTTEDGFEMHLGTNHLGHFALTGRLIDSLLASRGSRIVTVSSAAHRYGRMDFDDLMFEGGRGYSSFRAYARSKLANLLFAHELQRRLSGTETIALAAHPGGAATDLGRQMRDRRFYRAVLPLLERLSQSAAEGARSVLRAGTDPDVVGGECFAPDGLLGMRGPPVVVKPDRRGMDGAAGRRLWEASEELTGVRFL